MHDDFKIEKGSLGHITKSRNISGSPIKSNMFLQNINISLKAINLTRNKKYQYDTH